MKPLCLSLFVLVAQPLAALPTSPNTPSVPDFGVVQVANTAKGKRAVIQLDKNANPFVAYEQTLIGCSPKAVEKQIVALTSDAERLLTSQSRSFGMGRTVALAIKVQDTAIANYKSAQKSCGYDFSVAISKLEFTKKYQQRLLKQIRVDEKNAKRAARPAISAGQIGKILGGISAVVGSTRGVGGSPGGAVGGRADCMAVKSRHAVCQ